MSRTQHVLVVGGGIIGTHCAYYLAKLGQRVTLIDRQGLGEGCSFGNCGFVCPSHVLPLAAPGAIRHQLPLLLKRNSPFKIRPSADRRLWSWLRQFTSHCNASDMIATGHAKHALLKWSRELFPQIHSEESIDCEWESRGLSFVYLHAKGFEQFAESQQLIQSEFGIEGIPYCGGDLAQFEPALRDGVHGTWHYPGDTHLRSDKLLSEMRRVLELQGVEILEHREVDQMVTRSGRWVAAKGPAGEIEADSIVLATGAWAPMLERQLECRLPIIPGKGYSVTMPCPAICPNVPMIFEEHHVAVTPFQSGFRIGSMMEFTGYDTSIRPARIEYLKQSAARYLKSTIAPEHDEVWYGWRPMTPDDRPIIGRLPNLPNVVVAAGHGMLGLSMAPATGYLVAQILSEIQTSIPIEPYSIGR